MKSKRSRKDRASRIINKAINILLSREHEEKLLKIKMQRIEQAKKVYESLLDEFKRQNGL